MANTTIIRPNAHPETSSVDGWANVWFLINKTFANIRTTAGQLAGPSDANNTGINLTSSATSNQYNNMARSIFLFDTSVIPANAVINSATFGVYITSVLNDLGMTNAHAALSLVGVTPASNTNLVAGDFTYTNWTFTRYATDIAYNLVAVNAFNNMPLNAAGLAIIGKGVGGMTKLGLTFGVDTDAGTPAWVTSKSTQYGIDYADTANSEYDPMLTVIWDLPKSFGHIF